jgi:hypothetical protein
MTPWLYFSPTPPFSKQTLAELPRGMSTWMAVRLRPHDRVEPMLVNTGLSFRTTAGKRSK